MQVKRLLPGASHRISAIPHAGAKWTRAAMEPVMIDIRAGMKRKIAAIKHGISEKTLDRKIEEYNMGVLK